MALKGSTGPRKHIYRIAALCLGLFLALVSAEAAVRVLDLGPEAFPAKRLLGTTAEPEVSWLCYPSNPHGEFRPLPELSGKDWRAITYGEDIEQIPIECMHETPWCVELRYNSQGLRDREYAMPPPPGTMRILGMGDSFAMGDGVSLDRSLFRQLEGLLGPGFQVVNAGRSGQDAATAVARLSGLALSYGCKRAIYVFLLNDIGLTPELAAGKNRIHDLITLREDKLQGSEAGPVSGWPQVSRLLEILRFRAAIRNAREQTVQWYRDCYRDESNGRNLRMLGADFRTLADLPECRVALVIYPLMVDFETGYPFAEIHDRVARMAREAGLPVLDLAAAFQGMDTASLHVHPVDHHPNGRAHGLAARRIATWLQENLPGFLSRE